MSDKKKSKNPKKIDPDCHTEEQAPHQNHQKKNTSKRSSKSESGRFERA